MNLIHYRDDVESFEQLAARLGTSPAYLSQLAHGHRKASPRLCFAIERETNGRVTRETMRPDIFGDQAGEFAA